jgi:NitT/TauT family transport system substrate-binding protein
VIARWLLLLLGTWLAAGAMPARAADVVHAGIINSLSDVTQYMADERGYFRDADLDVVLVPMDSAAKMIAPIGTGELDVGGGATSAGLYNAIERGIQIRIVADRTTTSRDSLYQSLVIRKSLVDTGRFRGLADLKGLRIGIAALGVAVISVLNEAAKAGGISYNDVEKVYLSFPQQIAAISSGALDGSIIIEPFGTMLTDAGQVVRFANTEDFYPTDQIGLLFFSEDFATKRPAVATRYMTALLRAMRDYIAATRDGRIAGPGADSIQDVMVRRFHLAPELARQMYAQHLDADARVNMASIRRDWEFYRAQGMIKGTVTPESVVDMRFADAATQALGPFAPAP